MKTPTVLLVLEEPRDVQIYETALRSLGYKVVLRSSQPEATNLIETEVVDFVIVSQGTSASEGREVLERTLQLYPRVPVLVVARVLDVGCYLDALELGAVDCLERPEPQDLLWTVETQMRRQAVV